MKAMILAAGLGMRLKPYTDTMPKALVKLNGRPLLERLILRLKQYSFNELIINTHHYAEQIHSFLKGRNFFDIRIEISHEADLLDTGGGLKQASWFFDDGRPFLLHNADVLTDLDYHKMIDQHRHKKSLASLAVRKRKTTRYFLFDDNQQLCGWENLTENKKNIVQGSGDNLSRFSFMGIHVLSPEIFDFISMDGKFSIIPAYLELASQQKNITAFPADQYRWLDLGRKENLIEAESEFSDLLS